MSLIIAEHIIHAFGPKTVIKDISFRIGPSQRIGLVGPNGEGKTTLLRIIGGVLDSTLGEIHRSRGLVIGYLPQIPPAVSGTTIHETMLDVFSHLRDLENEMHDFAITMEQNKQDAELLTRYGQMQSRFETLGGYTYHTRIEQVLTGLSFPKDMWDRSLDQLSGGQRTRVYLATLLLKDPDVLLLDEPTNHLDLDTVEWLEYWLSSYKGVLMVVSHDRYFLDHVTSDTWEIAFGQLEEFPGSYSKYVTLRDQRYEHRLKQWESQQEFIAKTQDYIAQHLAGQRSRQAKGRRTRLQRFLKTDAIGKPRQHQTISINLSASKRTGDIVLRAENLMVGYDPQKPLFNVPRLEVLREDKIAIVGPNGTGKTTLLRSILGQVKLLAGEVILGSNVNFGYLSQTHDQMNAESIALDVVKSAKKNCTDEEARSVLGSLLLSGDDSLKPISALSGGQRSRVALARLILQNVNVLALDEPTNHLDIASTEIMQDVLSEFDGTILFVSHDRYLIDGLATTIWAIDNRQIRSITGGWEDYLNWRAENRTSTNEGTSAVKDQRKDDFRQARKDTNTIQRLKRRHEQIETKIQTLEDDLANLNQRISSAGVSSNLSQIESLGNEYQRKDAELKSLWNEWEQVGQELESYIKRED